MNLNVLCSTLVFRYYLHREFHAQCLVSVLHTALWNASVYPMVVYKISASSSLCIMIQTQIFNWGQTSRFVAHRLRRVIPIESEPRSLPISGVICAPVQPSAVLQVIVIFLGSKPPAIYPSLGITKARTCADMARSASFKVVPRRMIKCLDARSIK